MEASMKIGSDERLLESADAQWVNQSIRARMADQLFPCVQVNVRTDRVNVHLSTSCCPSTFGASRAPSREESELLELWRAYGLREDHPDLEQVWPFVMRLRRRLGLRAA